MGQTGIEEVTGQKPDILEFLDFDLYYYVWWIYKENFSTKHANIILGKWLGISHKIGSNMRHWVLMVLGKVVACTTLQHVIHTNLLDQDMKIQIDKIDEELQKRLDDTDFFDIVGDDLYIDIMNEVNEAACGYVDNGPSDEEYGDMKVEEHPNQEGIENVSYDKCIGAEVIMDAPLEGTRRE